VLAGNQEEEREMRLNKWVIGVASSAAVAAPAFCFGGLIGPSAFGPDKVVESFEGLNPQPGLLLSHPNPAFLLPQSDLLLASGVTVVVPTPSQASKGIAIGDYAQAPDADWGLGGLSVNGYVGLADVPDGTAYLGFQNVPGVTFRFSQDVRRVGAYVTGETGPITLSAFDVDGHLLDQQSTGTVWHGDWDKHFLGLEANAIRSVVFTGGFPVLDALTFEAGALPPAAAPLPPALGAGLVGAGAVIARARICLRRR
jgi:hypothetical protein